MTTISGECGELSHVAEGPADMDLSGRRSRFFCDTAVLIFPTPTGGRLLIQFADKRGQAVLGIVGFSGVVAAPDIVEVDTVYLNEERFTPNDGVCEFFYDEGQITGIACGAQIDADDRRTVPIIQFDVTSPDT